MGWILVTNDDGVDSPALMPLVRAIGRLGRVEVVVPDRERSWIGKAVTRHEAVTTEVRERDGMAVTTASGYPADCVQLAIHTLYPTPPRLVVSGINVGYNNGAGYIQSSGTVGAAMEALLADTPAVAFSAGSHSRPWDEWKRWVHTPDATSMWNRLAGLAADIAGRLLAAEPPPAVVNINFPDDATMETQRTITTVAPVGYERLFRSDGDGRFVHDFGGGLTSFGSLAGSDVEAAQRGEISITALRPLGTGAFTTELEAALTGT